MNERQKQEELQRELKASQARMANCKHDFNEAIFDPEKVKEGYGIKTVGQGSDVWSEFEGYHEVEKPRWSRKCKLCGKKEYTYQRAPVIKGYEPKF